MYDAIVVGLGGVGSAALYHLARRGVRALGLEQFGLVHDRGSSHGHSRVIRKAYFEHPDYVPLLRHAYRSWAALERTVGERLYLETGVLQVGPEDGEVLQGVLQSAQLHDLEVERLSAEQVRRRFPGFAVPEGHRAVLERQAGVLRVEAAVRAHLDAAQAVGAQIRSGAEVTAYRDEGTRISVQVGDEVLRTRRLVLSLGAYHGPLLADLDLPLSRIGKTQFWYPGRPGYGVDEGCPAFLFEGPRGIFYGIPDFEGQGVKLAEHGGGEPLDAPDAWARPVPSEERAAVEAFRQRALPGLKGPSQRSQRCMYTCTPDGHFIVDRHPRHPNVSIAAGLSGHGFKLVPALGEALADLTLEGGTEPRIDFLGLARLGDPSRART